MRSAPVERPRHRRDDLACTKLGPESEHMTKGEQEVLDKLADAWNAFCKLPRVHPSELPEFQSAIHQAQGLVACRIAFHSEESRWDGR